MVVRGALVLTHWRVPRCLLPRPVPELSTVLDLRQELANSLDIAARPEVNRDAARSDGLGCRYFLRGDVAAECRGGHTELLGSVARGERSHRLHCNR